MYFDTEETWRVVSGQDSFPRLSNKSTYDVH